MYWGAGLVEWAQNNVLLSMEITFALILRARDLTNIL